MRSFSELLSAVRAWPVWLSIAKDDVQGRYRRTVLGPWWLVLSQAGFIAGIYLLHRTGLGGANENFLLYLAAGLPVWGLITGLMTNGSNSMLNSKEYLESFPMPPAIFSIRSVAADFVTFAHTILVFVAVLLLQRQIPSPTIVAAVPGLLLVLVFGMGITLALGPLGARFRDIPVALTALMGLLFVLTPIFWVPNEAQELNPIVALNPLYYLLQVVRGPLLGSWVEPQVWGLAALVAFGSLLAGVLIHVRMRPTLIYWL